METPSRRGRLALVPEIEAVADYCTGIVAAAASTNRKSW
jgi:hypothetical protein